MASDNRIFGPGDADRTIIRPSPGGRRSPFGAPLSPPPAPVEVTSAPDWRAASHNPLLNAAAHLLSLVGQLRNAASHPDVDSLRLRVIQEVKDFELQARTAGVAPEAVSAARYALCSLLDETVLNTPWGGASVWGQHSLLITFHNEAWGGEKFFLILDRVMQEPTRHLPLLELMSLCLALGFEGKYRVMERGHAKLEEVRENLYRILRSERGDYERELSPHWRGVEEPSTALRPYVPLWVVGALAAALLVGIYLVFRFSLGGDTDPVLRTLDGVGRITLEASPATPAPAMLSRLLQPEIAQGLIQVREDAQAATIIIRGDGLFASGSSALTAGYLPLLRRIAQALTQVPGQVVVTGHTDDVPIRSLDFQSNWELSRARAAQVVQVLENELSAPGRLQAEGRADTEPLVPNDSAEHRARNRRVEITLVAGSRL